MSELIQVRAEIKTWERTFRSTEGREPTINDIKKDLSIAQKYRLYKKLSKAATAEQVTSASSSVFSASQPFPSTPSKSTNTRETKGSALLPGSRVVVPTAPLSTFNPFSPQKVKGKQRETANQNTIKPQSNPFASPAKPKPTLPSSPPSTTTSLTAITLPKNSSLEFRLISPPIPTAVDRARKRLRGEPVSPSPNKEKRRRTTTSQSILPFPRLTLNPRERDDETQIDEGHSGAGTSFVDDSPIKAPSTGRLFTLLFDESATPATNLFGTGKGPYIAEVGQDSFRSKTIMTRLNTEPTFQRKNRMSAHNPGDGKMLLSQPLTLAISTSGAITPDLFTPLSQGEPSIMAGDTAYISNRRSKSPLLPPSPLPTASTLKTNTIAKGKRKATPSVLKDRKKAKRAGNGDSGDSASDDIQSEFKVKFVNRPRPIKVRLDEDDSGPDIDPILTYTHLSGPHVKQPVSVNIENEEPKIEIDLPDKFRHMLDLESEDSKSRVRQEENLVQGLLYRRRVLHYDPNKGGEIWAVGEDELEDDKSEVRRKHDIDEEWEGEPIPWEVGEL